jgi:large subunit ribosomal protein L2
MAIITKKPRNSSLRFQTYLDSSDITKKNPEKSLVYGLRKRGGRNSYGRITVRYRGGGAFQKYRMVDFKRADRDIEGRITSVEYDPNRNVRIGLVSFLNGAKKYILLPEGLGVGSAVMAGEQVEAKTGNCLPIKNIPVGFQLHNIEITPN